AALVFGVADGRLVQAQLELRAGGRIDHRFGNRDRRARAVQGGVIADAAVPAVDDAVRLERTGQKVADNFAPLHRLPRAVRQHEIGFEFRDDGAAFDPPGGVVLHRQNRDPQGGEAGGGGGDREGRAVRVGAGRNEDAVRLRSHGARVGGGGGGG